MAPNGHSRLSPSSAYRWSRCPGSVNFIEDMEEVDETEGTCAAEGTILHALMEKCLRRNCEPYEFLGRQFEQDGFTLEVDEPIADMLMEGLDYIDTISGKLSIEQYVDLSRWMPGQGGTLDLGFLARRKASLLRCSARHVIWDNKFGYLPVSPIFNEQLMLYALGFWDNIARHVSDVTKFRLIIWQPRAPGGGGEWDVDLEELLAFGKEIKEKAAATYGKHAKRVPGPKQCLYCPGAKHMKCREYEDYNLDLIVSDFEELDRDVNEDLPPRLDVSRITPERRAYLLEHRAAFSKFFDRLHQLAYDDAEKGRHPHLMKLVDGRRGARKWGDEEAAKARLERLLRADAYSKKLLSPAQAEKELPPKIFKNLGPLITQSEPKPVLVSAADARKARPPITDLFDD